MDDSMDLNNFDVPATILPAQYSKTEVMVDIGQQKLKRISVQEDTELTVHFVVIDYLHSVKFKKMAVSTRYRVVNYIELFLKFTFVKSYLKDSDVPMKVFEEFTLYIKENTKQTGGTVGSTVSIIKVVFEWYLDEFVKTDINNNYSDLLITYLAHFPKFQKGKSDPYQPLSNLFPDCPYSDTVIIKSLRLVCCWLLLDYDRQRNILLGDSKISTLVSLLKKQDILNPPVSHAYFSRSKLHPNLSDESKRYYAPVLKAVLNSNDPVLMERVIKSTSHPFGSIVSIEDMKSFFRNSTKLEEMVSVDYWHSGKGHSLSNLWSLSFRDLFAPSLVEVFTAQCFLASDRVQSSNLERLKLVDVVNNDTGTQAQHVKGRRPGKHKKGLTIVYPPKQLIHDALEKYFDIVRECQTSLPTKVKGLALPYISSKHMKNGYLGAAKDPVSLCFSLLITEGSHTQKALLKDVTIEDAQPFLWIVKQIFDNNLLVNEQVGKHEILRNKNKKLGKPKVSRGDIVTHKRIGLSPTFIGQSRVAMDGGNNIQEKGSKISSNFNDSQVEAQLTMQTAQTKHNTYHDRSNAKEVIESRRKFAVQMGDLMVKDATKMGELMKNTQVVNLNEAKKVLGCASTAEDFQSLVNELDEDIGLTGEIICKNKVIFIANDLTAALIILKMSHIEEQLPRMLMDDPNSQFNAKKAIGEKVYLQTVLDRFPEDVQVAGKLMSVDLTFSFSDLI